MAASLRDRGFGSARIVVDSASYSFTVHAQARLRAELPQAQFVHRPGVSDRLRAVKDDSEIALLRQAANIADRSMERLCAGVGPGVTVRRAGALAASSYLEQGADGGDVGRICRAPARPDFSTPSSTTNRCRSATSCTPSWCPGAALQRAHHAADRDRLTERAGPARGRALVERLVFHQDRQIEAMAAGAKASDVDAVLREALLAEGIRDRYDNVTGYTLGIYGRTPRSSDFSRTFLPTSDWSLEAGMVFHMYTSADGIGVSDSVLVTERGGECLTRTPRRLLVSRGPAQVSRAPGVADAS